MSSALKVVSDEASADYGDAVRCGSEVAAMIEMIPNRFASQTNWISRDVPMIVAIQRVRADVAYCQPTGS